MRYGKDELLSLRFYHISPMHIMLLYLKPGQKVDTTLNIWVARRDMHLQTDSMRPPQSVLVASSEKIKLNIEGDTSKISSMDTAQTAITGASNEFLLMYLSNRNTSPPIVSILIWKTSVVGVSTIIMLVGVLCLCF